MFGELRVTCRDCFQLYSNLHDVVSSIPEIPEVRVQLSEWRATLHLCVGQYVQVWGNGCTRNSHPTLGKTSGFLFCCCLFLNYFVLFLIYFCSCWVCCCYFCSCWVLFVCLFLLFVCLFVCLFDFITVVFC